MSAALQKAKGPAATAIAPDHGSQSPKGQSNMKTDSTAAPKAPDFPIPYPSQGPEDDMRDALTILRILDQHFDAGSSRGFNKEMVGDVATMVSMARELLLPIQRYLNNDMRAETCGLYHVARRAEILSSFRGGQA